MVLELCVSGNSDRQQHKSDLLLQGPASEALPVVQLPFWEAAAARGTSQPADANTELQPQHEHVSVSGDMTLNRLHDSSQRQAHTWAGSSGAKKAPELLGCWAEVLVWRPCQLCLESQVCRICHLCLILRAYLTLCRQNCSVEQASPG